MKKFFTMIAAVAMMLTASAASVTVYDGNATSDCVPINSAFMDWGPYYHQVIYPQTELTALVGQQITAVKYYVQNEAGSTLKDGKVALYIGTTDKADFSDYTPSFLPESEMTRVAEMPMVVGLSEIEFTFDTPWTYTGGNIVIETVIEEDGVVYGTVETRFYGMENSAKMSLRGKSVLTADTFAPKTSFIYNGGDEPQVLRGDVNQDTEVNIKDVTALINILMNATDAPAEANCDGEEGVTIKDVTALITYLMTQAWPE